MGFGGICGVNCVTAQFPNRYNAANRLIVSVRDRSAPPETIALNGYEAHDRKIMCNYF